MRNKELVLHNDQVVGGVWSNYYRKRKKLNDIISKHCRSRSCQVLQNNELSRFNKELVPQNYQVPLGSVELGATTAEQEASILYQ